MSTIHMHTYKFTIMCSTDTQFYTMKIERQYHYTLTIAYIGAGRGDLSPLPYN